MQIDLTEIVNSYEVIPVSLGDLFKSLVLEPSALELMRDIAVVGFIALLITAIFVQAKKSQVKSN